MNFLLMTLGSIGDFFPFLAIAEGLRKRGHKAVLASNANYAPLARMAGFEFAVLWERTNQSLDHLIATDPERAWAIVHKEMFLPATGPARDCILHYATQGRWGLIASWTISAGAWDGTELPRCRIYLSPHAVAHDMEHQADGPRLRNIGLFPDWFGAASGVTQTDFAMLDDAMVPELPSDLDEFLLHGPAPVVFTPGSFMRGASAFFNESLMACQQLGLRAIFLSPYREQIPQDLPATVRHYDFVPLQKLAKRSAAVVHHGGIGTCAQGLRAGIPQLVTPLFFDQPDNAVRLLALGVSRTLPPRVYRRNAVATELEALLQSAKVKTNCELAARRAADVAVDQTCGIAETMAS